MKIVYAGGGSGGPVSPLLAVHERLVEQDPHLETLFIGTKTGPEKGMVEKLSIRFTPISSGKFRRYFSFKNLIDPFKIIVGTIQARSILKEFKPDAVLTAGSFVAGPVYYAAKSLKIPVFVHQQDLIVGLSNKIMARGATTITTTFKESLEDFDVKKTYHTSNPVRKRFLGCSAERGRIFTKLAPDFPTILILGGGQGAKAINQIVLESLGNLVQNYQVIHVTGAGKGITSQFVDYYDSETRRLLDERYKAFEFINEELCDVMESADLVITRAGISTLTELSVLGKPTIIIPIPGSHQEANAQYYAKFNAALQLDQKTLDSRTFIDTIVTLLGNDVDQANLSRNISKMIDKDAAEKQVELIQSVVSGS